MRRDLSTLWSKPTSVTHHELIEYTRTAPALGSTVATQDPMYMSGTLDIYRNSDNHKYVNGTDFEEVEPGQFTNVAISPGEPITVEYFMNLTDVSGTSSAVVVGGGEDGDSAYEIWLSEGNTGTITDFLNSLIGPPGDGVTDHGSLSGLGDDDHTQYYNQSRGDARYERLSNKGANSGYAGLGTDGLVDPSDLGTGSPSSSTYLRGDKTWGAVSGGITDHGALTGLSDDDHLQYHDNTRGDARYYTKAEIDAFIAGVETATPTGHYEPMTTGTGDEFVFTDDGDIVMGWVEDEA